MKARYTTCPITRADGQSHTLTTMSDPEKSSWSLTPIDLQNFRNSSTRSSTKKLFELESLDAIGDAGQSARQEGEGAGTELGESVFMSVTKILPSLNTCRIKSTSAQ